MSFALSGCSKVEKKEEPKKEKPVVTDMNIKPDAKPDAEAAPEQSKKDEVESLPMDSDEEEEQLPALGAGG